MTNQDTIRHSNEEITEAREWLSARRGAFGQQAAKHIETLIVATVDGAPNFEGDGNDGLICHGCGSSITQPHSWKQCADVLGELSMQFEERAIEAERELAALKGKP